MRGASNQKDAKFYGSWRTGEDTAERTWLRSSQDEWKCLIPRATRKNKNHAKKQIFFFEIFLIASRELSDRLGWFCWKNNTFVVTNRGVIPRFVPWFSVPIKLFSVGTGKNALLEESYRGSKMFRVQTNEAQKSITFLCNRRSKVPFLCWQDWTHVSWPKYVRNTKIPHVKKTRINLYFRPRFREFLCIKCALRNKK